mmetsp:Transcript_166147/g.533293  ORF Transcript_166147/g.533293 Transcript_166147/m.533293 type:complete len:407 (-) Transcript_166147:49-1269(-)
MGRRAASSGAAACSGDAQQLEPGAASTLRSVLGGPALVAAAVGVLGVVAAFCSQAGSVRQEGSAPAQPPPLQPLSAAARPDAGSSTAAAGVVPPMPEGLQTNWECAARCAAMTDGDKAVVERTLLQAGCDPECTRDGVLVDAAAVDAEAQALGMLKRCGVVQLKGGYDAELLGRVQRAIDTIAEKKSAYNKLVDRKQLHDGRFQVYLPFRAPFAERAAIGVSDLVLRVLDGYFDGRGFGIDHVSVLTSSSPSGNQSLHPDVPYFKGLTVSVHTALVDVTTEMGPTYFCPCTGEALRREDWPGSAAIKMTILKQKACFGPSFAPSFTSKGTVTIYDGAMFHQGLANGSGKDRPVLKLEVGAEGFPERRNYIQMAPSAGKKQTRLFREALGPPRMGAPLRDGRSSGGG